MEGWFDGNSPWVASIKVIAGYPNRPSLLLRFTPDNIPQCMAHAATSI